MSGKNEKAAPAKKRSRVTAWNAYVTILGTILGLVFTFSQVCIAWEGEERARRVEPLAYTLDAVDTHYEYEIQRGEQTISVPAPSLRLQVTHGSLHAVTAISFDGTAFYEMSELPIQDGWEKCVVDITVPPHAVITEGDLVYDYFFLYLEPSEGRGRLDLICTTISLDTHEVKCGFSHPLALVQTDFLPEGPQREMLSVYSVLYEKLGELDLLAA